MVEMTDITRLDKTMVVSFCIVVALMNSCDNLARRLKKGE